ncbi:uncharacterized protein LOC127799704 [Diospyros lotus]|uniref:uncharacterized protein LOC127799704 n=1 Tax=Diospyros lotus TaxID=55363 RepID=UPI00225791FB|nr:uncharacterized protein LOC127799704 [Diospyros lotus]
MDYRVKHSYTIQFEAGCKNVNCKFMLRARCGPGCSFWHVVKFMPSHMCTLNVYDSHFRSVKAIVIESLFSKKVASSKYTPRMLMGELLEQHGVQIIYTKAWRPCLHGFRSYIRPVVAVDATHLKDEHKWVIFVTTYKDGEEMIYPIAFRFADGESDRSWIWFLTKLKEAIGVREDLVIISDHHQSIANAMSHVFPFVPHVFCFFHLKQNLKKHCRQRKDVMTAFYLAAYSYTIIECDTYLAEI